MSRIARQPPRVRALESVVVAPIRAYRALVSPLSAPRCRFHPSCSAYAFEAIRTYGIVRGLTLAAWRVLRCNPWNDGGLDPPDRQRIWSARHPTRQHEQ